jgi:hypothetical protein
MKLLVQLLIRTTSSYFRTILQPHTFLQPYTNPRVQPTCRHDSATTHTPERATHVQEPTRPQPIKTDEWHDSATTHTLARNPRAGAETHKHTQSHTRHRPQCTPTRPQPIKTDERHDSATTHTLARNPRAGAETHNHTQPHTQYQPQCTHTRPQPIKINETHDSATTHPKSDEAQI